MVQHFSLSHLFKREEIGTFFLKRNAKINVGIYCRLASWTEWKILYILCKDKNGLLHKDTVKAVYDGSLFERMEKETSSAKKKVY
jgi:hypothetical protein